jgi:hydroxypyruvate isomerase
VRWSAHVGQLFTELPLRDRFAAAVAAGFEWFEMYSPYPDEDALADAIAESGGRLTGFNLEAGDLPSGERGFLNVPARGDEVREHFRRARRFGERTGAAYVSVLVGSLLEDRPSELQTARRLLLEGLEILDGSPMRIVVEALNPVETPRYLLTDIDEAAAFVDELGDPRFGLMLDAYHVARAGADPVAAIRRHAHLLAHIQIADCPGRGPLGSGEIDVAEMMSALDGVGYRGNIGLEYLVGSSSTLDSLEWLPRELRAAPIR